LSRIDATKCAVDESGDPVHGGDGGAADRGATRVPGSVRSRGRRVGEASRVDEDGKAHRVLLSRQTLDVLRRVRSEVRAVGLMVC